MSRERRSCVYIYADDLGHGMLSCYGQRHFLTPNIDRLTAAGGRFTRACVALCLWQSFASGARKNPCFFYLPSTTREACAPGPAEIRVRP